ncbi:DUF5947 family protein [Streptomyces sp. NPDC002889]|uniref:DUF5947 family protein n=1 Tax=Streptomyces sp. NPDC002889 TaxID=3364669 RepID=UPI0036BDFEF4
MSAPQARPEGRAVQGRRGLRRFTMPRPPQQERCELCGVPVPEDGHRHLVDTEKRALACACSPCAQLMARPGASRARFRAVPDRYLADPDHRLDDGAWELLQIPVGVAFFFHNAALGRLVALYPSPAGATESEVEPSVRQSVLRATLLADELEPDVEALLVRRTNERTECYLVPIDICYSLVGRMRLLWQGFDGGAEARADLEAFFDDVRRRARTPQGSRP